MSWLHEREIAARTYRYVIRKAVKRYRQDRSKRDRLLIQSYWPLYRAAIYNLRQLRNSMRNHLYSLAQSMVNNKLRQGNTKDL